MKCPWCEEKSRVLTVHEAVDETVRKRRCNKCGRIFYTSESDMNENDAIAILKEHWKEVNSKRRTNKQHEE